MLEGIVRYFDLQSGRRPESVRTTKAGTAVTNSGGPKTKHAPVLPQYAAVALGVLSDPLLRGYIASGNFNFDLGGIAGRTVFALLMAIVLLPAVYKNAFDLDKPIAVQLCALFASGLGWQSLFQAATQAVT